jgi:hypothetical protein
MLALMPQCRLHDLTRCRQLNLQNSCTRLMANRVYDLPLWHSIFKLHRAAVEESSVVNG